MLPPVLLRKPPAGEVCVEERVASSEVEEEVCVCAVAVEGEWMEWQGGGGAPHPSPPPFPLPPPEPSPSRATNPSPSHPHSPLPECGSLQHIRNIAMTGIRRGGVGGGGDGEKRWDEGGEVWKGEGSRG